MLLMVKELCAHEYVNFYIIQLNGLNCHLPVTVFIVLLKFKVQSVDVFTLFDYPQCSSELGECKSVRLTNNFFCNRSKPS